MQIDPAQPVVQVQAERLFDHHILHAVLTQIRVPSHLNTQFKGKGLVAGVNGDSSEIAPCMQEVGVHDIAQRPFGADKLLRIHLLLLHSQET